MLNVYTLPQQREFRVPFSVTLYLCIFVLGCRTIREETMEGRLLRSRISIQTHYGTPD